MIIGSIDTAPAPGGACRVSAQVVWEQSGRAPQTVFFELPADYLADETTQAGAMLMAAALPALHCGEARLRCEQPVEAAVLRGIEVALAQLSDWYGYDRHRLLLDARGVALQPALRPPHAGSFFSGGVDSFWTLCNRIATLPAGHPLRVRDAVLAYGFDMGWGEDWERDLPLFAQSLEQLRPVTEALGVRLLPVATNVRSLFSDSNFWAARWHGMVLAAVAALLSGRLTDMMVPATNDLWHPGPWGSSPLIEPQFSGPAQRIYHDGVQASRLDKVRRLAEFPQVLPHLRVCTKVDRIPAGFLNCGVCEKCVRTQLELLASGVKQPCPSFAQAGVRPAQLSQLSVLSEYHASEYQELIEPLRQQGDAEMVAAVAEMMGRWERYRVWRDESDWKGLVKRFGRRYLGLQFRRPGDTFTVK